MRLKFLGMFKGVLQGTVKDCGGRPLPGVTVRIKGTTLGVATDQNGGYRLELPADKEIRILFHS
ncbi:MAG: carboxypeptidase-like regulatory domain-containing protein [Eubacterium ramulus]